ncbi:glycosyltransferase family 59 protein [Stipitochalara longipes BDJ]|nr:glycosyltransferase family 59 protein [Stipitochalara longipes BDJ]
MPCGDPAVGWRAQLDWQARAQAAQGGSPGIPHANLYSAAWWFVGGLATINSPLYPVRVLYSLANGSFSFVFALVYLAIYYLASFWANQVTKVVPNPYLDEVFHIPQAQAYCVGRFDVWDPKLTTPPGLYLLSTLIGSQYSHSGCMVPRLRSHNIIALIFLLSYAIDCRGLVILDWKRDRKEPVRRWIADGRPISADMLHTAANTALFPLLFFFSGLYYTDVLSTCVVLGMYRLFLERKGARANTAAGLVWLYLVGLIALTMRQTNIFWVAVFMGALELVRTIKANKVDFASQQPIPRTLKDIGIEKFQKYSHGNIHDVALKDAGATDFILCAISIALASVFQPLLIITRLWPYILLLTSFAGFVVWNGGVVLGDKSNHVATIHIPQMLYIWPLMAFFSAPLVIPAGISFFSNLISLLSIPLFPRLVRKYLLVLSYIAIALAATLLIVKYNTIIHPFTLADNRHYMFYVFRYTILRHPLIRYLLAPIYIICAYLIYLTLSGPWHPASSSVLQTKISNGTIQKQEKQADIPDNKVDEIGCPTTSFLIILLATTALSLITAPLVEPRYFIIPWVIWRLNVPHLPSRVNSPPGKQKQKRVRRPSDTVVDFIKYWGWEGHDYRLWLETTWFLLINFVTGYIFLYRGFEWPQEPGLVQRFMW